MKRHDGASMMEYFNTRYFFKLNLDTTIRYLGSNKIKIERIDIL